MITLTKKQEPIKIEQVMICRVTKENHSYATHINEFPQKYCLIIDDKAIDLEMNCYYDFIKIPGYTYLLSVFNQRFKEYEKNRELLFCLSNLGNYKVIERKEELKRIRQIITQYQNGEIPYINDYLTPEQYEEKVKQYKKKM